MSDQADLQAQGRRLLTGFNEVRNATEGPTPFEQVGFLLGCDDIVGYSIFEMLTTEVEEQLAEVEGQPGVDERTPILFGLLAGLQLGLAAERDRWRP